VTVSPPGGASPRHAASTGRIVPKVAIVLRTKDRPILLARALASILCQRFGDWELRIVNDGGDPAEVDATLAPFLPEFAGRAGILHNPDSLGMEAASNRAIDDTQSDYIVVHDDDDSWHPDFLAETVSFLERPENAGYGGVVTWSELVEERIEGADIHITARRPYNDWLHAIDLTRLLGGNVFPPISFLFRRCVLEQVGAFDENLKVLGDWEFNVRLLQAADIAVIPTTLAYYHHRVTAAESVYSNSIQGALGLHRRTNAALRNRLVRASLAAHPAELGVVAAISHDFVQLTERLNAVETYLDEHLAGRVIERLNQVEAYLAGQDALVTTRLNEVETYLASQSALVMTRVNEVETFLDRSGAMIERLNQVEAFLGAGSRSMLDKLDHIDARLDRMTNGLDRISAILRPFRTISWPLRYIARKLNVIRGAAR
jgi:glycosyltransferase involved in cell wall biosynthesis